MSTRRVFLPLRPRPAAREIEVDVLPVPPFCEAIAITIDVTLSEAFGGIPTRLLSLSTLESFASYVNKEISGVLTYRTARVRNNDEEAWRCLCLSRSDPLSHSLRRSSTHYGSRK